MKRTLLIITLLFPIISNAQFKVIPKAAVEYNVSNNHELYNITTIYKLGGYENYTSNSVVLGNLSTKLGIEFQWRNISAHFDNQIYMIEKLRNVSFYPTQANFSFKLQYQFFNVVNVYGRHECYHPINTNQKTFLGKEVRGYNGGTTVIGISYNY